MSGHLKRFIVFLTMLVMSLSAFVCPANAEDSGLTVYFLDVGQADAAVVICDDEVLMIDGGNVADSSLIYSYLTNTLGLEHIDYMIGTHAHEDHIGGLSAALNACTVGTVYSSVTDYDSDAFQNFRRYAEDRGVALTVPDVGDTFDVGEAEVEFLAPVYDYDNVNDQSIVVRIEYGDTSFLFTGDAEWDSEHDMIDNGANLSADVLKVGHHGSDTSSNYVFLREVMPRYAVISVGEGNSYGHPTEETLSRLSDVGAEIYRTDLQGTIICKSDGQIITFQTEKTKSGGDTVIGYVIPSLDEGTSSGGDAPYIGNANSYKFHYSSCSSVDQMNESNKVEFYSRDEAINAGYNPCKRCDP